MPALFWVEAKKMKRFSDLRGGNGLNVPHKFHIGRIECCRRCYGARNGHAGRTIGGPEFDGRYVAKRRVHDGILAYNPRVCENLKMAVYLHVCGMFGGMSGEIAFE